MKFAYCILAAVCAIPAAWAQSTYHITDLGALTGTSSAANGISNNGLYVTGSYRNGSTTHAFLYGPSGITDIGTLGTTSIGESVNNTGQVAGYSAVSTGNHAFLYSGGTMSDLGVIGTGASSMGYGINNSGAVVGYTNTTSANSHAYDAFLYSGGTMQDLGVFGGTSSYGMVINDNGAIAGYYTTNSATTHAFSYIGGTFTDLGTLGGLSSNIAGISSKGQMTGSSSTAAGSTHAILYANGTMTDIGTLTGGTTSRASGINSSGVIVGESLFSGTGFHGIIYSGGVLTDINTLLDPSQTGYVVSDAVGISDGGVIAAVGTVPGGQSHALLLTPIVSNPQTIAFDAIPNQILRISPFPIAAEASSDLPVTFASTTQTVCKTASGLVTLLTAGTCSITASQGGNSQFASATASQSFTITPAAAAGTLAAPSGSPFGVGGSPYSVAVGYFNGDSNPDVAVANSGDSNVTVLLGDGSGGFAAAAGSPFSVGTNPSAVAVGDFNADGKMDVAVSNKTTGDVTILLGNGSGGFTAATGSPFPIGNSPIGLVVGDFNGDGIQDLAAAVGSNTIAVLLGNGAGKFTAASASPFLVGTTPLSLAVADFNGDGFQDLAIVNRDSDNVTILLGNSSGGFTAASGSPILVGAAPQSVVAGDFDADGKMDLAVANGTDGNVSILLGNGSGGFAAAPGSPVTVGTNPFFLVVADLNGDGVADLAVVNQFGNNLSVLLGNGSGGFAPAGGFVFPAGNTPFAVAAADFNRDGIEDLAIPDSTGNNLTVLLGGKSATTATLTTTSPANIVQGQSVPLTLGVADISTSYSSPTGTATFLDGATSLGAANQTSSPFTFSALGLAVGTHTLSASYGGDSRTAGSLSNSVSIRVLSACDVNRDGATNTADAQLMLNEALGGAQASNDLDSTGVVNVVDAQIVINAALGLPCGAH